MQHRVVRANPVGGRTRAKTHRVVRVNPIDLPVWERGPFRRAINAELSKSRAESLRAYGRAYQQMLRGETPREYVEDFKSALLEAGVSRMELNYQEHEAHVQTGVRRRPNPSAKFERCVQDVKKSNRRRSGSETKPYNPWAICHSSLKENPMPRTRRAKYNPARRPRAAKPFNEHHVDELLLYATNDEPSYRHAQAIMRNMATKARRGTYDPHLAVKAWLHWADRAAKKYAQEYGSGSAIFSPADRREAAKRAVDYYAEETAEHLRRLPALRRPSRYSAEKHNF